MFEGYKFFDSSLHVKSVGHHYLSFLYSLTNRTALPVGKKSYEKAFDCFPLQNIQCVVRSIIHHTTSQCIEFEFTLTLSYAYMIQKFTELCFSHASNIWVK